MNSLKDMNYNERVGNDFFPIKLICLIKTLLYQDFAIHEKGIMLVMATNFTRHNNMEIAYNDFFIHQQNFTYIAWSVTKYLNL